MKAGSGSRAIRPSWQRLLSTRSARLCIAAVGCVALVTYVWVVFFLHPARMNTSMGSELRVTRQQSADTHHGVPTRPPKLRRVVSPPPPPPATPSPIPIPGAVRPMRRHPHQDEKYRIWKTPASDGSPRCKMSGICDGKHDCGEDKLGCITDALQRKQKVVEAARWTWKGYRQYAWGHDELNAGSRNSREWFNMGLTIVDSLDTLQLLGLREEYAEARFWVINHLDFNQGDVSVFETTIRILGGLVSAFYHSGGDELFLLKAVEFADRLMPAFNTTSGLPAPHFDVHDKNVATYRTSAGSTCLAEIGTLSMEFSSVAHLSGRTDFRETVMVIWAQLSAMPSFDGLYCTMLNGDKLSCNGNHYTYGPAADSAYEYMLKQWILTNGTDTLCLDLYKKAIQGMRKHMLTHMWMGEDIGDVWIPAELDMGGSKSLLLPHLTCFLPGTMALGHMYGINTALTPDDDDDLMVAVKLAKACYELYRQAPSGVAYDSVRYNPHYSPPPPSPPSPSAPPPPPPSLLSSPPTSTPPVQNVSVSGTADATIATAGNGVGSSARDLSSSTGSTGGNAASNAGSSTSGPGSNAAGSAEGSTGGARTGATGGGGSTRRRLLQAGTPELDHSIAYEMVPMTFESFLRPEVAETMFYLWRATGDPIYREWGWNMFRAYEKWCRVSTGGYEVLSRVDRIPPIGGNKMESFWMAETLKYFYLLFSDDPEEVPLDEFVFNTEAHPLAIWGSPTDKRLVQRLAKFHTKTGKAGKQALERLGKIVMKGLPRHDRVRRR